MKVSLTKTRYSAKNIPAPSAVTGINKWKIDDEIATLISGPGGPLEKGDWISLDHGSFNATYNPLLDGELIIKEYKDGRRDRS